jgi:hypothetical protein
VARERTTPNEVNSLSCEIDEGLSYAASSHLEHVFHTSLVTLNSGTGAWREWGIQNREIQVNSLCNVGE